MVSLMKARNCLFSLSYTHAYTCTLSLSHSFLAKDFISKLLVVDAKARATAAQCLSHPWLQLTTRKLEEKLRVQLDLEEKGEREREKAKEEGGGEESISQIVSTGVAHAFELTSYVSPHFCSFCQQFLWG